MKDATDQKWATTDLGEVIEIVMGQAPAGKDCNKTGEGTPFVKTGEFGEVRPVIREWTTDPKKLGKASDVFISVVGATCGKINLGADCAIGRSVAALRPISERLDQFFLHYFMEGQVERLRGGSLGAAQTVISKEMLARTSIPLPPLEEQQRIVAALDQAFEGLARARAHAEANLQNARELFESAIEAALERAGGEPVTLQEMMDTGMITGHLDGNHGSDYPRKAEFVSEGVPYISANCIANDEIDFSRCKYLTPERASGLRKGVAKNRDVLFAHNATVGPVTLLKTEEDKIILSTSLTYYRCNEEELIPEFLVCEMRSAGFRRQYEAVMAQATRNQVPITMQRTFTHLMPLLAEQRRIAELGVKLEANCNSAVKAYEASIKDLGDLRQSLLQKAFAGELT